MSKGVCHVPQLLYDPSGYAVRRIEETVRPISSLHANLTTAGLAVCLAVVIGAVVAFVAMKPPSPAQVLLDRAEVVAQCGSAELYRDPLNGRYATWKGGGLAYIAPGVTPQQWCQRAAPASTGGGGLDMNSAMLGAMGASLLH